jgi:hypothetical protein
MEPTVEKMDVQLKRWSLMIDHLAAKTQAAGDRAGFEAIIYVDELKSLHAIALLKLDEFRAGEDTGRARLKAEMKNAWEDLDAAFKRPMP